MERTHPTLYFPISKGQSVEVNYHQNFSNRHATLEIGGLSAHYPGFKLVVDQEKFPLALIDDLYKKLEEMQSGNGSSYRIEEITGAFQEILNPDDLGKLVKGLVASEQVTADLDVSDL